MYVGSKGFAKINKSQKPVILKLQDKHYCWIEPPPDTRVPHGWLAESAIPASSVLQGSASDRLSAASSPDGRAVPPRSVGTPSAQSYRDRSRSPARSKRSDCRTPSVNTLVSGQAADSAQGRDHSVHTPSARTIVPDRISVSVHDSQGPPRKRLRSKSLCSVAFSQCSCQSPAKANQDQNASICTPSVHMLGNDGDRNPPNGTPQAPPKFRIPDAVYKPSKLGNNPGIQKSRQDSRTQGNSVLRSALASSSQVNPAQLDPLQAMDNAECKYRPDVAPFPRQLKKLDEATLAKPQDEQVWVCPQCNLEIRIPAGLQARFKLRKAKDNHLRNRHTKEEARVVPRMGLATQIVQPSHDIPAESRAWTCVVCQMGLLSLPKTWRISSIQRHFKDAHPGITPTEAYRHKQRNAQDLRARMAKRGAHAGSVKRTRAMQKFQEQSDHYGHSLSYIIFETSDKGYRQGTTNNISWLVCSHCRKKGTPQLFKNRPCSEEVKPLCTHTLRTLQNICRVNAGNRPEVIQAYNLTEAEQNALRTANRRRLLFKQPAGFQAALDAGQQGGHKLRLFEVTPKEWPVKHSDVRSPPRSWITCLQCRRFCRLGTNKPCSLQSFGSQTPVSGQQNLDFSQKEPKKPSLPKLRILISKLSHLNSSNLFRLVSKGEPKRPKPLSLPSKSATTPFSGVVSERPPTHGPRCRAPRARISIWTVNVGGAKQAWNIWAHLKHVASPDVVFLQETNFSDNEWRSFNSKQ